MTFINDFIAFNINAFYEITYFFIQNIFVIIGLLALGYCFLAEEALSHESKVHDERQIL